MCLFKLLTFQIIRESLCFINSFSDTDCVSSAHCTRAGSNGWVGRELGCDKGNLGALTKLSRVHPPNSITLGPHLHPHIHPPMQPQEKGGFILLYISRYNKLIYKMTAAVAKAPMLVALVSICSADVCLRHLEPPLAL